MNWSELEDIIIDSRIRLGNIYIMFGWNKEKGFANKIKHNEALGENGAVKDVAKVWENVTTLCNYMFADGTIDVTNDLLEIRQMADELLHEAKKHESCKQLAMPCHKVVQNIDMYFRRRGNRQDRELKDLLPDDLKGAEVVNIFQRAIDTGRIKMTDTGLEWVQIGKRRAKRAQVAYFCGKLCGYKYDPYGNKGGRVFYKDLESLFGESRLDTALTQVYEAKRAQSWREEIDNLFS